MSDAAELALSYRLITLLRMRACAKVATVLPALGFQRVHSESSEGFMGSSKFHTVTVIGTVTFP